MKSVTSPAAACLFPKAAGFSMPVCSLVCRHNTSKHVRQIGNVLCLTKVWTSLFQNQAQPTWYLLQSSQAYCTALEPGTWGQFTLLCRLKQGEACLSSPLRLWHLPCHTHILRVELDISSVGACWCSCLGLLCLVGTLH